MQFKYQSDCTISGLGGLGLGGLGLGGLYGGLGGLGGLYGGLYGYESAIVESY